MHVRELNLELFVGLAVLTFVGLIISVLVEIWHIEVELVILPAIVLLYYVGWTGFDIFESVGPIAIFLELGYGVPLSAIGAIGSFVLSLFGH